LVIPPHRQRLGVGQGFLKFTGQAIHTH
jgi:hypothetical protein